MRRISLIVALSICLFFTPGRAAWGSGFHLQGMSGAVRTVLDWNGTLVVGGAFAFAGAVPARNVAARADGVWFPLGDGLAGEVLDLTEGSGGLLALMRERVDKTYWVLKVMHWAGSAWAQLGPEYYATSAPLAWYHGSVHLGAHRLQGDVWVEVLATDGSIDDLTVYGDDLIASGRFQHAGGVPASCIAAWNDGTFSPLGAGLPEVPWDIVADGDRLHVVLGFENYSWLMSCEVRTWDGSTWSISPRHGEAWCGFDGIVAYEGNILVFGAYGAYIDSPIPTYMASTDGSSWTGMTYLGFPGFDDFCTCDGRLIAVGGGRSMGDTISAGVIAFDGDQWRGLFPAGDGIWGGITQLQPFQGDLVTFQAGPGCGPYDPYYELLGWDGGAWSLFATFGEHVDRLLGDGNSLAVTTFPSFFCDLYLLFGTTIWSCVPDIPADPTLYHDGALYAPGPVLYRYADGDWIALTTATDGDIESLAFWNGALIASGAFTSIDGHSLGHIGAYGSGDWTPLGSGLDAPADLMTGWAGKLVASGPFTTAGGQPAAGLAAWDGHAWIPLSSVPVAGEIHTLCGYAGELFAGGDFTHIDGVAADNVARFDGAGWHAMGAGIDGPVHALAKKDWRLFMVGDFTAADGHASHHVAVWAEPAVANELQYFRAERDPSGVRLSWLLKVHRPDTNYVLRRRVDRQSGYLEIAVPGSEVAETTYFDPCTGSEGLTYELVIRGDTNEILLGQVSVPAAAPTAVVASLHPAAPNPFNPSTTVAFSLTRPSHIRLTVHDARGQRVRILERGPFTTGRHRVEWDGRDDGGQKVPSGVYFACLFADDRITATKLVLAR